MRGGIPGSLWRAVVALVQAVRPKADTPLRLSLLVGCAFGLFLLAWTHPFVAILGWSPPVTAGLGMALAVCVSVSCRLRSRSTLCGLRPTAVLTLLWLLWTPLVPKLCDAALRATAFLAGGKIPGDGFIFGVAFAIALMVFGWPCASFVWLGRTLDGWTAAKRRLDQKASPAVRIRDGASVACGLRLIGVAMGVGLGAVLLAPWWGAMLSAISGGLVVLVLCGPIRAPQNRAHAGDADAISECRPANRPPVADKERTDRSAPIPAWPAMGAVALASVLIGASVALAGRILQQMFPFAEYVAFGMWSALSAGVGIAAIAFALRQKASAGRNEHPVDLPACAGRAAARRCVTAWLVLASVIAWLGAGYGVWLRFNLWLNAYVANEWALQLLRLGQLAAVLVPVGAAWGGILFAKAGADQTGGNAEGIGRQDRLIASAQRWSLPLAVAGYLLMRHGPLIASWGMPVVLGMTVWLCVLSAGSTSTVLDGVSTVLRRWASRPVRRVAAVAVFVLPLTLTAFVGNAYDPVSASRLLFDSRVLVAFRNGFEFRLLSQLNDERLAAVVDNGRETLTAWTARGALMRIRADGVPRAVTSYDADWLPQYPGAVLHAVVPLALHESPRHVLLLQCGAGSSLQTCLRFPVRSVRCVEADADWVELVDRTVFSHSDPSPWSDERLQLVRATADWFVACDRDRYDVILSVPGPLSLVRSTSLYTERFYRRAAARLTEDGIFCQRIVHVDFGPEPLQTLVATMMRSFRDTMVIESAPGEWLLLGTNSDEGLIRPGLVERLKRPQARESLAQLGWDWSLPLTLSAYNRAFLKEFVGSRSATAVSLSAAALPWRLPREVMRWAPKQKQLRDALVAARNQLIESGQLAAGHTGRLLEWIGPDGQEPALLRRLSEVAGYRRLVDDYPDRWWGYRRALRESLQTERTATVVQAAFRSEQNTMHPVDRRRRDYLLALAAAGRSRRSEDILRLEEFARPYDPLIGHFLHHEMAVLLDRSDDADAALEFAHRWKSVSFAPGSDRSVRNVVAAIRLLVEHPDAVPNPTRRWDLLNGLLQILENRWELRGQRTPLAVHVLLNDIQMSLEAVEDACRAMQTLAAEAGIPAEAWDARREVLTRTLIRPLGSYRARLASYGNSRRTAEPAEPAEKPAPYSDPAPRELWDQLRQMPAAN